MESPRAVHATLSATLRQLRIDAGLSQMEAAAASGLTQAKISRLEAGRHTPRPEDVERLAAAYRTPAKVRRQLEQTARDLTEARVYSRIILQRGAWRMQEMTGRIERDSALIRTFQPTLVPGVLQTRDYAAAVFASAGIAGDKLERTVQARLARRTMLGSNRKFRLLMTEGALRWQLGSPALMLDQLAHLVEASRMRNVDVGIIPYTATASVVVQDGFNLYDSRAVIIATRTATATITEAGDIGVYERLFAELEGLAAIGPAARREIERIAGDYRRLTS